MKFKYDKETNTLTVDFEGAMVILDEGAVISTDVEDGCPVMPCIENAYLHFGEHRVKKIIDRDIYEMLSKAHSLLKDSRPSTPGLGAPISLISGALSYMTPKRDYWKERCQAAEAYIAEVPCDHDIHYDQHNAYLNWINLKNEE